MKQKFSYKMTDIQAIAWRKGIALSATFLLSFFLIVSCKKKDKFIGQNHISSSELLASGGVDTFSLVTYTVQEDSTISDNPAFSILGSYSDPEFGPVNAEIYTQLRLAGVNPNFGDISTISIDSVVLGLQYAGYYGNTGDQTVEVFEINDVDGLSLDSTYYSFTTKSTTGSTLVPLGSETLNFNPSNQTVIGEDTVDAQLRIYLDTNFGWNIINEANSNPASFASNEAFLDFFKGFHIRTNNMAQMPGEGGLFYFSINDPLSKMTIYYTQDGTQKRYDLVINSECADFNHVDIQNAGTNVQTVIDTPSEGQKQFYAQSFGSRARVEIPGLDNLPKNAVVHKAILELPVQYQSGTPFHPGLDISVATYLSETDKTLFSIGVIGGYDDFNKRFSFDMRNYVQAVVNGEAVNTGLVLSPILFITSGDRIIFNGPETANKVKPKLTIVYTEF